MPKISVAPANNNLTYSLLYNQVCLNKKECNYFWSFSYVNLFDTSNEREICFATVKKTISRHIDVPLFFRQDFSRTDSFFTAELINDNYFEWAIWFVGPSGTLYENGSFHAILTFPESFPNNPPQMRFIENMWHPNIYPDGTVCISILHSPGVDVFNQEEASEERWRPILGVESIMTSVLFMLGHPNLDSPANINAAIEMRDNPEFYKKKVRRLVELTLN